MNDDSVRFISSIEEAGYRTTGPVTRNPDGKPKRVCFQRPSDRSTLEMTWGGALPSFTSVFDFGSLRDHGESSLDQLPVIFKKHDDFEDEVRKANSSAPNIA